MAWYDILVANGPGRKTAEAQTRIEVRTQEMSKSRLERIKDSVAKQARRASEGLRKRLAATEGQRTCKKESVSAEDPQHEKRGRPSKWLRARVGKPDGPWNPTQSWKETMLGDDRGPWRQTGSWKEAEPRKPEGP